MPAGIEIPGLLGLARCAGWSHPDQIVSWLWPLLARFVRDLRAIVIVWTLVLVVMLGIGVVVGEPVEMVLAILLFAIAITPIAWIRWSRPLYVGHHAVRRNFAAIGIALLWSLAVLLLGLGILATLGIE